MNEKLKAKSTNNTNCRGETYDLHQERIDAFTEWWMNDASFHDGVDEDSAREIWMTACDYEQEYKPKKRMKPNKIMSQKEPSGGEEI